MRGEGYGKIILFGEHFVVYGKKGVVSGLRNIKTVVEIKEAESIKLSGEWNVPVAIKALENILEFLGIKEKYYVEIIKEVPPKQNLGSSSALCVAFARALNKKHSLGLSDEEISRAAYEGEKAFHGTPSGIDNTASTFGSPLIFQKSATPEFEKIELKEALDIAIIPTGIEKPSTKELVEQFRRIKESGRIYEKAFSFYEELVEDAITSLKNGSKEELGKLMDLNHLILSMFELSTIEIENKRAELKKEGSIGSKITGAGKGGNIIALFKNEREAKESAKRHRGYYARIE